MVAIPPSRGRTPSGSPDAVLAEAQRIAADIRRRAEREANAMRREAAEWASATRRDAERYRERIVAELEHARAVTEEADEADEADEPDRPEPTVEAEPEPTPVIVDLRSPGARPMRLVETADGEGDDDDPDDDEPAVEVRLDVEVEEVAGEVEQRPAVGGTYVVGRSLPAPGTSIETKVHDVVRLAVRRTFHRRFP